MTIAMPIAMPVENGYLSSHFGDASAFLFVKCRRSRDEILDRTSIANPHRDAARGKGTEVARWLVGMDIHALIIADPRVVFRFAVCAVF